MENGKTRTKNARQIWRDNVRGRNFMTPLQIKIEWLESGRIGELSRGTGFSHERIYGVTVIYYDAVADEWKIDHDISKMFYSKKEAVEHMEVA